MLARSVALSITFIAIENVIRPKLGPGRLAVVFGFGLVHGLGFASSLSSVPFPKNDFVIALLGFNFGVDFGQLFVIALAFLAVGWFRRSWSPKSLRPGDQRSLSPRHQFPAVAAR
jgi:hypothetical protein